MLYVLMTIAGERYGVESKNVIEVVPAVQLEVATQGNPELVCGELSYHGNPVPVVDGGLLLTGRVSHHSLSTRIVILDVSEDDNERCLLGFLAEEMTETVKNTSVQSHDYTEDELNGESMEIAYEQVATRGFHIINTRYVKRVALYS